MAVNFNLLAQQGPQNLYQGFVQGQEQAAQNALAQQKMAQEQQMNALRREQAQLGMQQTRAEMAGAEEDRARKRRAERVGMYRERILRAATPEAAREIVRMQFADPEFGPLLSQAGTLEQSLAEIPDEPTAFERYRQQEAMGMAEWLKSQQPKVTPLGIFDPATREYIMPPPKPEKPVTPPMVAEYQFAQTPQGGGFRGSYQEFVVQREAAKRPPPQPRAEPAPRTQQVTLSDGTLGIMNMDTGAVTRATVGGAPARAKPSAFAEKSTAQREQLSKDLTAAISELRDAAKEGGLIDQSTGSGAGRLVDVGARFVGQATKGDIAIGKLAPVADLVLKMVPRFEGPQSDKDTQSYKEAAGQLADATLPREIRKQAAKTIIRLMENRKGQFVTREMAAEGVTAPPAAGTEGGASGKWEVVR